MIAIVAAMPQELATILDAARADGEVRTEVVAGRELHWATLAGREVVLALSGVGKVAAAATAAVLAERVEAMIMVGTAGGLGEAVNPGDVVVATELLQHDFDARPLWDRWVSPSIGLARVPANTALAEALTAAAERVCAQHRPDLARLGLGVPRVHRGLIISGDVFVATAEASAKLQAELPDALAVEMEGAALAQICYTAGVPFAVARTVSDRADHDAALDFPRFLAGVAAPYAHDLVIEALARL
jgi:adenosylhomocysteine nucleosidase